MSVRFDILLLVKLEKYVLRYFFRHRSIVKEVICNAVDHRLVAPNNGSEFCR